MRIFNRPSTTREFDAFDELFRNHDHTCAKRAKCWLIHHRMYSFSCVAAAKSKFNFRNFIGQAYCSKWSFGKIQQIIHNIVMDKTQHYLCYNSFYQLLFFFWIQIAPIYRIISNLRKNMVICRHKWVFIGIAAAYELLWAPINVSRGTIFIAII